MLRSELYELEKCIDSVLHENRVVSGASYLEMIAKQVSTVQSICSDLQKKWIHELLSSAKDQVIKRYVQYHQAGIIQLSDKVSSEVPDLSFANNNQSELKKANAVINLELEKLLEFLRRQFYQYFDIDHKSTIYHCRLLKLKIAAFEPELRSFQENAVEKILIECVLSSVREVIDEGELFGISYRQSDQCLNLVRMMHQLLIYGSNATTYSLLRALYQQNMNSLYFFNW